jgi:hypothetical protein
MNDVTHLAIFDLISRRGAEMTQRTQSPADAFTVEIQ